MSFIYNMADTWNAGGTTFTAVKMNVTDTASAAGSLLMDLQVGGVSQFSVSKAGAVTTPGGTIGSAAYVTYATGTWTPAFTFTTPGDLSATPSFNAATYTKIGRRVFLECTVNVVPTYTTASGAINITGLPFPAASNSLSYYGVFQVSALGAYTANTLDVAARISSGASVIAVVANLSTGAPATQGELLAVSGNAFNFRISISYDAAT